MKQSVILASYINTTGLSPDEINTFLKQVAQTIGYDENTFDDITVKNILIPIKGESRIECVYPSVICDDKLKEKFSQTLDKLNEYLSSKLD